MPDYFEFLQFPRSLSIDEAELQRRYFRLSREYHPDFHAQSDDPTRQLSLEQSSVLNSAYRTLKDPFDRARYLLELESPGISDQEKKNIPPSLLMEVMEMQEKIAEAKFEEDRTRRETLHRELGEIESRLKGKLEDLRTELGRIAEEWDIGAASGDESRRQDLLRRLRLLLDTRNYLRTLIATLAAELHGGEPVRH